MSSEIHFILQGKGGVGKSVAARMLVEYMIHTGRDYIGLDADPVNQSLAAVEDFKVRKVDLLLNGEVVPEKFDALLNDVMDARGKAVIVDCGASSFVPLMGYIESVKAIEALQDKGFLVFVHTVVVGGAAVSDTVEGFEQLTARFGDSCEVIVWTNPIFGPVEMNGTAFSDLPSVKKAVNDDKMIGAIQIPALERQPQDDFANFLASNSSFRIATAKLASGGPDPKMRRRLAGVQAALMASIRQAIRP